MFRVQGSVDFAALAAGASLAEPAELGDGLRRIAMPGLSLCWDARRADCASSGGIVAMTLGRARPRANDGEAVRWIEQYRRVGDDAPKALDGGYAVALIDIARRRALLLVDRFSIETLCYAAQGSVLRFADAACDVPGSRREIDAQAIYDYLYFHVIPSPQTVYRDVRRLPPAHALVASAEGAQLSCYWHGQFVENDRSDLAGRRTRFVDLVRQSVATEADEPATACFLSGGTDSSTVAGMLARLRGEPVHAYSIGFASAGYDEIAYARIAARHFGLVHHEHYLTADDLCAAIPAMARSFDQPFGNSSVLAAYYCGLRAREDGFTRMLAGDGGDELFGGNSRYALQKALELYHGLPSGLRAVVEPLAERPAFRKVPGLRQLGGYVRHARVPMPDRMNNFLPLPQLERELFEPAFRDAIDTRKPLEQQRATWRACDAASLVNRMLCYDWKFTLADSDLPKVRSATQLAGVSVGYPLLSHALTDFSLALPPEWKLRRLKLRWFFKDALRGFLPSATLRKRKHGFGLPFGPWLLQHAPLRRLAEQSLAGIAQRGIVRPAFVDDLMTTLVPRAPGYYGEMVWLLMMLEQWLAVHAPGHAPDGTPPSGNASPAYMPA
jgi:asparagine synthase (glutamine-hydrolysing)